MTWDVYKCPSCGADAPMGIMSLVARCENGCRNIYASNWPRSGWYYSLDAYYAGMPPMAAHSAGPSKGEGL